MGRKHVTMCLVTQRSSMYPPLSKYSHVSPFSPYVYALKIFTSLVIYC